MTTVLVAGGTGMLGSRIADYLVKETGVQVRLLVRDGWEDEDAKRQRVECLKSAREPVRIIGHEAHSKWPVANWILK
jgi:nucleoside-diphosphate-sugar epimerase